MNRFITLALSAFAAFAMLSCSDSKDEETPFPDGGENHIMVAFDFVDYKGNSYLSPEHPNSLYEKQIIFERGTKAYSIDNWTKYPFDDYTIDFPDPSFTSTGSKSRSHPSLFYGYQAVWEQYHLVENGDPIPKGRCWLRFGEIDGALRLEEDVRVTLPEYGKSFVIHISNAQGPSYEKTFTNFTVNGKEPVMENYVSKTFRNGLLVEGPYRVDNVMKIEISL